MFEDCFVRLNEGFFLFSFDIREPKILFTDDVRDAFVFDPAPVPYTRLEMFDDKNLFHFFMNHKGFINFFESWQDLARIFYMGQERGRLFFKED